MSSDRSSNRITTIPVDTIDSRCKNLACADDMPILHTSLFLQKEDNKNISTKDQEIQKLGLDRFRLSSEGPSTCHELSRSITTKSDLLLPPKESFQNAYDEMSINSIDNSIYAPGSNEGDDEYVEEIESIAMESFPAEDLTTIGSTTLTIESLALMSIGTDDKDQHEKDFSAIYESSSTRIMHVRDAQHRYGEHSGFVAIKMLVDQYPSPMYIAHLENEYELSRHLSGCKSTRSALNITTKEGFHALYLDWVKGTTLREWIKSIHGIKNTTQSAKKNGSVHTESCENIDYKSLISLAFEISKALEDIHRCGVVHNSLTTENIIVEGDNYNTIHSVKIIDLGLASIIGDDDDCRQNDIHSLGAVLYELFCGINPFHDENSNTFANNLTNNERYSDASGQKGENTSSCFFRRGFYLIMNSTVPVCLSSLVLNLTRERGQAYHSVAEVVLELQDMHMNPHKYFIGTDNEKNMGRLKIPKSKLYGRDRHLSILMDAFKQVSKSDAASGMVLVSGYSGAGKSALVQHFRQSLSTKDANFLFGKFEQFHQAKPLSAIVAAFTQFCNEIITKDDNDLKDTRDTIKEAIGSENSILEQLIPTLREITGSSFAKIVNSGSTEAQNGFLYVFRLFVRALATPDHPLVLCLDDLQWADIASLELITSLITDIKNKSLLLIGLFRENEVDASHPLSIQLEHIKTKANMYSKIEVENLDRTHVNELVSDALEMSPSLTSPLSDIIYRKTSGNALFVLQFFRSLYDEGILKFSFDNKLWQWDIEAIESKNLSDDTVGLMSLKIFSFPEEAQSALKVVACLGYLSEELIECVTMTKNIKEKSIRSKQCFHICRNRENLIKWLDFSVNEGLIDRTVSGYDFAHDQIQLAAYSFIPENERKLWHLQIGTHLLTNKNNTSEQTLFVAVGQMNQGASLITEKYERIELAFLNLLSGEEAISLAVYPLAATFLEMGIDLIDGKFSEENYELSLKLFLSYAEACYCDGHFEKMNEALNTIFTSARCLEDKRSAYFIQIRALGAQSKVQESVRVGLSVLESLGESFPKSVNQTTIAAEFSKTKQMLEGKTDTDILVLCNIEDNEKKVAMKVLRTLLLLCTKTRSKELPLFAFRMIQLSLCYGLSEDSAFAFASFGYILRGSYCNIKDAYKYGQISLHLVEKFRLKKHLACVYIGVFTGINSWVEHHQASIEPLKYAYTNGMKYGDIQYALMCAKQHCVHRYQCGENLDAIERDMKMFSDEMLEHKQESIWRPMQVWRQAVLNLMGRSDDPSKLTGEAIDQDYFLEHALERKLGTLCFSIYHNASWIAYIFGNYELASQMAEKAHIIVDATCSPSFSIGNHVFVGGLISLALARKTNQTNWKSAVAGPLEKLKQWAECGPSNFQHKYLLLQAECAFLSGSYADASVKYDAAIQKAGENGFVHEQALAYELAGLFHMEQIDLSKASTLYGKAHDTYLQWGAKGKADHLRLNCPF